MQPLRLRVHDLMEVNCYDKKPRFFLKKRAFRSQLDMKLIAKLVADP